MRCNASHIAVANVIGFELADRPYTKYKGPSHSYSKDKKINRNNQGSMPARLGVKNQTGEFVHTLTVNHGHQRGKWAPLWMDYYLAYQVVTH